MTERVRPSRPWWLNRAAMISLVGLGFSAVFALVLGFLVPRQVGDEFLAAQAAADQATLDFLVSADAIPAARNGDVEALDEFVRTAIFRGDFVRAKLWAPDGTIIYSDAAELIGRQFVPDEDFESMREPMSHISDLEQDENVIEATEFGGQLLETYVPVLDNDEVVAVWEIYRPLNEFDESVQSTRALVWWSVGSGLAILGIFLISSFGLMIRTANEQKEQAESRSKDLAWLLDVAQATTNADDPANLADLLSATLGDVDAVEALYVTATGPDGNRRVLLNTLEPSADGVTPPPDQHVQSSGSSGELDVRVWSAGPGVPASTMQAFAEEVHVGFQKALLTEGLNDYQEQLERVMDQIVAAEEGERRRLAGEIHDGLAQDLYRVLYGLRSLMNEAPPHLQELVGDMESVVLEGSRSLRRLLNDLHPTVVEDVGLAAALRSLADRITEQYGLDVALDVTDCPEPDNTVKLAVYRIAQEALVNSAKHSGQEAATLAVTRSNGDVVVNVRDRGDGRGARIEPGMGMWLMRERAENLGGRFDVASEDGWFSIRARIPLEVVS